MVPGLYLIYPDIPHQTVIATSMGVIFFNGILNSYNFRLQKKIPDYNMLAWLGLGMVVGGQFGSHLTFLLDQITARKIFASILLLVIIRVYFSNPRKKNPDNTPPQIELRPYLTMTIGVLSGIVAGISGLGGGVVIVPALMTIYKIPFNWVSVYSNPAMAMGSFSALITFCVNQPIEPLKYGLEAFLENFQWGFINFALIIIMVFFSFLSSKWGTKLTEIISPKAAKTSFLTLLTIIMFRMFLV